MRRKPESCGGCVLQSHGTDFSRIEGTGSSKVLVCGEASGEQEAREGTPFVKYAPSGSLLERTLRRMGIDREQLSITNVCRCRPRNNWLEGSPWEFSALNSCRKNLDAAIAERKPRAIAALGGIATRELTGLTGEKLGIGHLAGYVLPMQKVVPVRCDECISFSNNQPDPNCFICGGTGYVDGTMPTSVNAVPVIPTFHPSFLRRGKASYQGVFARILNRAMNVAKGTDTSWIWNVNPKEEGTHGNLRYIVHPSLDAAGDFARRVEADSSLVVSYDIETFESASLDEDAREGFSDTQLRLVQFSTESGTGIAFPWDEGYKELTRRILHARNVKCGHNVWLFDNKVLRAVGEREGLDLRPRGVIHDTLQMFHHWQPDLPAHLQFAASFVSFPFPWKHFAGEDIEFYGCADVDATLRLFNMLQATLKRDGLWGDEA